jgi:TonB-dependent Receptor Plug Domain/CarboxypepD_reg-like domain
MDQISRSDLYGAVKLLGLHLCFQGVMVRVHLLFLFLLIPLATGAQRISLRGTVRERGGDRLPLAHIFILPDSIHLAAGDNGKFDAKLLPGRKSLAFTFVGYENLSLSFTLTSDTLVVAEMVPDISQLSEVVVSSGRYSQEDILKSSRSSLHVITESDVESIPMLGGEADLIKTLQLLPGVVRGVEGSSDLFVRGGAADQNLVLLDDVPIYNTSHLLGFVSVFNPDVLDKVESVNGGFPADYGGRLSSILNVQTVSDIPDRTKISGDVGLIASRLSIKQPILKNKIGLHLAGRRTYIDKVMKAANRELPYFFSDLNAKLVFRPSTNDEFKFSYYGGEDVLDIFRDRNNDGDGYLTKYVSGNNSQSFQWQHQDIFSGHTEASFFRSKYRYSIVNIFEDNQILALSDIEDYGVRIQWTSDSLRSGRLKAGIDWTRHSVSPSVVNTAGFVAELLESSASAGRLMHEGAAHAQYEMNLSGRWTVNAGVRASMAEAERKRYFNPEARLSARYKINEQQSIKMSYSRMVQYIHRIANSAITSPADIWFPVTKNIKPQTAHQVGLAWQRFLPSSKIFLSTEAYYKTMNNLIGYEEGTNLFFNTDFEPRLIQGNGTAYGAEVLVKKEAGKLTGWISYTLSWSWRQFDQLNGGQVFLSRYDRRHNGALVAQYKFHPRWAVSCVWEFVSGSRFTPVIGQYLVFAPSLSGVDLIPLYTKVNEVKLADTHRLDFGLKFKSRSTNRFHWEWFAGVYNAYNRANPIGIMIERNRETNEMKYLQPGLFGLIPFVTYGFKF